MTDQNDEFPDDESNVSDWIRNHLRRYIETDGEEGHIVDGCKTLILTTVGRKSGKRRRTPLVYGEADGNYIVIASKGGAEQSPHWFHNLRHEPEVHLQVRADKFQARARLATPEERQRFWPMMVEIFPPYADYQTKTEREIPVVVLSPIS